MQGNETPGADRNDEDKVAGDGDRKAKAKQREQGDTNRAHPILNHSNDTRLRQRAKQVKWKLTGTLLGRKQQSRQRSDAKPIQSQQPVAVRAAENEQTIGRPKIN